MTKQQHIEELQDKLRHMLRAILYNLHRWPRCASCGDTNNLTEVTATPEGAYHLCPEHLAEEDLR